MALNRGDHTAVSSLALLDRARAGDQAALNELLKIYLPRLRRWASGRLPGGARDMIDTEDVVQETVIAALRNLEQIEVRGVGALQAYLRRAISNRLVDVHRQQGRRPARDQVASNLPSLSPSPLEEAIGGEVLERYERALVRLSPGDREAVILRIEMCCDYDEIALALDKSSAAHARTAVSRALARLSREMTHDR